MKFILFLYPILLLSGCATFSRLPSTTVEQEKPEKVFTPENKDELISLKEELKKDHELFKAQLEARLKRTIRNEILPEMRELSTYSHNVKIRNSQNNIKKKVFKKTVIGRVEWIKTTDPVVKFRARVDTGAQTNSMHAENITEILRDGKKYVEFTTVDEKGKKFTLLKEVLKETKVKSTSGVSSKRYVIQMDIIIGEKKLTTNVNLNDRKSLRHNFLIGRNLLLGNFIIDVSQSRLLGE